MNDSDLRSRGTRIALLLGWSVADEKESRASSVVTVGVRRIVTTVKNDVETTQERDYDGSLISPVRKSRKFMQ